MVHTNEDTYKHSKTLNVWEFVEVNFIKPSAEEEAPMDIEAMK